MLVFQAPVDTVMFHGAGFFYGVCVPSDAAHRAGSSPDRVPADLGDDLPASATNRLLRHCHRCFWGQRTCSRRRCRVIPSRRRNSPRTTSVSTSSGSRPGRRHHGRAVAARFGDCPAIPCARLSSRGRRADAAGPFVDIDEGTISRRIFGNRLAGASRRSSIPASTCSRCFPRKFNQSHRCPSRWIRKKRC